MQTARVPYRSNHSFMFVPVCLVFIITWLISFPGVACVYITAIVANRPDPPTEALRSTPLGLHRLGVCAFAQSPQQPSFLPRLLRQSPSPLDLASRRRLASVQLPPPPTPTFCPRLYSPHPICLTQ